MVWKEESLVERKEEGTASTVSCLSILHAEDLRGPLPRSVDSEDSETDSEGKVLHSLESLVSKANETTATDQRYNPSLRLYHSVEASVTMWREDRSSR